MGVPHDDYKKLSLPDNVSLEPCPCCGADTELWQYSTSEAAPTSKLVCCSNGEQFSPQDGALGGCGCVMYMPPQEFYKATIKAAVAYWNEWAKAMCQQQRSRRWTRAKVLRDNNEAKERSQETEPTSCGYCDYEESDGSLIAQCPKCKASDV